MLVHMVMRMQPRFTVGVNAVVLDESRERVLLVEHVFHGKYPWGLPGGWINRGEDPARTAEREVLEETNLRVQAVHPLIVRRAMRRSTHLDVVFLCELDGPGQNIRLNHELLSYRWAAPDALPPIMDEQVQAIEKAWEVTEWNTGV
jgi:8-oxo-dGTP diphosphatase